jgi:hypothetical protein
MKRMTKLAATVLAANAFVASAAFADSITSTATATIVAPISIVENQALSFGTFASTTTPGQVSAFGTSGAILRIADGQLGIFTVTGTGNSVYTLDNPGALTLSSAGRPPMSGTVDVLYGQRNLTSGTDTIEVNGILDVPANQPSGTYTGTYTLNVHY